MASEEEEEEEPLPELNDEPEESDGQKPNIKQEAKGRSRPWDDNDDEA